MLGNSSPVISNQSDIHPRLEEIVKKHLETPYREPVMEHSVVAFEEFQAFAEKKGLPIVLDSGCGTGESSENLSKMHPEHLILGIDKSIHRLSAKLESQDTEANLYLMRADVVDIWRLLAESSLEISKHYILYPNPWPKKKHILRRWHGHPVFPTLIGLGKEIVLRSNWEIYVREFGEASELAGRRCKSVNYLQRMWLAPRSPFERKYSLSGHSLVELTLT